MEKSAGVEGGGTDGLVGQPDVTGDRRLGRICMMKLSLTPTPTPCSHYSSRPPPSLFLHHHHTGPWHEWTEHRGS